MFENFSVPEILFLFAAAALLVVGLAYLGGRTFARRRPSGQTPD
ncbi:hypothetical protein ACFQO7_09210 [Catellatospora aurea]|uniref:Secreted protein with PEP-CTERM sorting signal n=1 Tax=Catellatospora aurea TaxID=1337874 RepID=A0ABW2GRJ3_9ACTN